MIMYIRKIFMLLILAAIVFGCETHDSNPTKSEDAFEPVTLKSKSIYNANVDKIELENRNNIEYYEVYMSKQNISNVKLELAKPSLELYKIYGEAPPFEYDLNPGIGLMNFTTVKLNALNSQQGDLVEWKLEKDTSNNNWEYRIWISENEVQYQLRLDAVSGELLEIKSI